MAPGRITDDLSSFDIRRLLLFEELVRGFEPTYGRRGALTRAVSGMPLVFDLPSLSAAVGQGEQFLASLLADVLSWVASHTDWPARRNMFTAAARAAHLAEAHRRLAP